MAYTNRAMIANHVAVGHFVSYVSWIRYVDDTTKKLSTGLSWVPYVSQALNSAKKLVDAVKKGTEAFAPAFVISMNSFNEFLHGTQITGQLAINGVFNISDLFSVKIMDKVAKGYDQSIRVNYKSDLSKKLAATVAVQVGKDAASTWRYMKRYTPAKDAGRVRSMIRSSYAASNSWMKSNRGWWMQPFPRFKLGKEGRTWHTSKLDWRADDKFIVKIKKGKEWDGTTLSKGVARATRFSSGYKGIHGYYDLKKRGKRAAQSLKISAYATMPVEKLHLLTVTGKNKGVDRMAALSRAEIFYQRPEKGFRKIRRGEYANLYNPFWQVRLTGSDL